MNKPQLFCFTYAGGTASFFDNIEKDLSDIDVVKLEYAGHGTRHKEAFCSSFNEVAEDLYSRIKLLYNGGEYSLFGYSMGTITLVEVLKRIVCYSDITTPTNVFLAAHEPYSMYDMVNLRCDDIDEWVKERTIMFGGVPDELLHNNSFWRMYLPIYRADYTMIGRYRFEDLELKLDIPTTVFYSETDTPRERMDGWGKYFTGSLDFHQYEGMHFFIKDNHLKISKIISQKMLGKGEVI